MSIFECVNLGEFHIDPKDCTETVQRAIDRAVDRGVPLYVPAGLYRVRTLYARNGLIMTGSHPGGYGIPVARDARFGLVAGHNASMFVGKPGVAHVFLSGLHFDGNKNNNQKGSAIDIQEVKTPEECQWRIRDCFIEAAPEHGIYIGHGRRAVKISDCTINYNGQNGIRVNASDAHIDRCIIGSNKAHGIGVGGTVCNIESCDIYQNEDGICIYSTLNMVGIHGNRIDRQRRNGITVTKDNKAISVTGSIFHSNAKQDLAIGDGCEVSEAGNVRGHD